MPSLVLAVLHGQASGQEVLATRPVRVDAVVDGEHKVIGLHYSTGGALPAVSSHGALGCAVGAIVLERSSRQGS